MRRPTRTGRSDGTPWFRRVRVDVHAVAGRKTRRLVRVPTPWYTRVRATLDVLKTMARACAGREISTGRKVAIKKIKVGQFKDGLDMSAIREVKYLRELKHQNVIEVPHLSNLLRYIIILFVSF